ncbi:hypothetical protein LS684_14465 [Cytobacillus spongiae]|uniref:YqgU-like beta propeller domain-containing protein n=1 Tax=Cytobacillus spongiae TaxID=2901381 RepID=UPI001F38160D|nr:hypothetical protein [Cytobacillus spongiae]UII54854.1 hypothetical protein LS684_14465 [Cytobacillus spongiae]
MQTMKHRARSIRVNYLFGLIAVVFFLFLSGCAKDKSPSLNGYTHHDSDSLVKQFVSASFTGQEFIAPIRVDHGRIEAIAGWLTDDQLVYSTSKQTGGVVLTYQLTSGKSEVIYESPNPIVSIKISPSKEKVLIYTAPSTYEGKMVILSRDGEVLFKGNIATYDISFEWNPYDENQLLISTYTENWEHESHLLNIKDEKMNKVELTEPFANWLNQEELFYLNWQDESSSLFAPLVKRGLTGQDETVLFDQVFRLMSYINLYTTITVDNQQSDQAIYTFYRHPKEKIASYTAPHLTRFSDWLVPFHDYNESKNVFFSLQPLYSGESDTYGGGFQLVSFDLEAQTTNTLMSQLNNEPISCSPNGEMCLYGNYYEKLIDLKQQKIIELMH